jgi:L-aminopeptidase/D-esterase-like protein
LISGDGKAAVRTGVTAILPQGKSFQGRVFAAWHALNGNGEMTGTAWITESGGLGSPVMITNTHSVGTVRDAVIEWGVRKSSGGNYSGDLSLPVVAETYDGFLSDINGFHVNKTHVFQALDSAKSGAIAEGYVGGGTGMVAHRFKGGTEPRRAFWKRNSAVIRSRSRAGELRNAAIFFRSPEFRSEGKLPICCP